MTNSREITQDTKSKPGERNSKALEILEEVLSQRRSDSNKLSRHIGGDICFKSVNFQDWCRKLGLKEIRVDGDSFSKQRLAFIDCYFGEIPLKLRNCNFQKGLDLSGSIFLDGADIDLGGSIITDGRFAGLTVNGNGRVNFTNASFKGTTEIEFSELDALRTVTFAHPKPELKNRSKAQITSSNFDLRLSGPCFGIIDFRGAYFYQVNTTFRTETEGVKGGPSCSPTFLFDNARWDEGELDIDLKIIPTRKETAKISEHADQQDDANASIHWRDVDLTNLNSLKIVIDSTDVRPLDFSLTQFPDQGVSDLIFGNLACPLNFDGACFKAAVNISQKPGSTWDGLVSFRGARFEGPVSLNGLHFRKAPDFTGTLIQHHLSFQGLQFNRRQKSGEAGSANRSARLLRLKELASQAGDHQMALHCHAEEMREARWSGLNWCALWFWRKHWSWNLFWRQRWRKLIPSFFDWLYDIVSGYGQMISRPTLLLLFFLVAGGLLYSQLSSSLLNLEALSVSAGVSLPFFTISGASRNHYVDLASELIETGPWWITLAMGGQALLSFVLIFLIGLGLRNRFRI